MSKIDTPRLVLGGLVAGAVINAFEGLGGMLYLEEMMTALRTHGLSLDTTALACAVRTLTGFIAGGVAVWFYAAVGPRFGLGPGTAALVGFALWLGGYFPGVIGYRFLGILPGRVLVIWGVLGLLEFIAATVAGASIYRPGRSPGSR